MATTTASTGRLVSERINRIEFSSTMAIAQEAAKLRATGVELVDFGAGEPFFPTPQHIKDAGIRAINENKTKYTAVAGIPPLRKAIVERHAADFGSAYTSDEAVFSTGGKHALFNALQVLVEHGDEVILPVPYWVSFKDIVNYAGGKCVYLETRESENFRLTPQMVERVMTPRTRAIILNTPNNPSGAVVPEKDVREIVRLCHERGVYVITDECYVYLNYAEAPFSVGSLKECKEHIVVIGSLSKTYSMTGWRAGYALAPLPLAAAMTKLQSQATSSPNAVSQYASLAALTGPQECIAGFREEYKRLREIAVKGVRAIPGVRCTDPQGAFYVYFNVSKFAKTSAETVELARRLLHEGHVVAIPGEGFGNPDFIRISYAVAEKDLRSGLERMKNFFSAL